MYTPESCTVSDIIDSDEVVVLNIVRLLQVLDVMLSPGNIIKMSSLLNSHTPLVTLFVLKSVMLLPTGMGF